MKFQRTIGAVALMAAVASSALAVDVYGLTDRDQLVLFDSGNAMNLTNSVFIWGQASNESIVGIDFRPSDNQLYAVGSFGNVYTLNRTSGMATYVSTLVDAGNNPVQLMGTEFGVDFNPAADRLRVVSNSGMNLRINVATGATIFDGVLNQSSGTPYIVGAAYTNNDNDPGTGTALYTIDSTLDVFNQQNSANAGTQVLVGSLGSDVTALGDIDILTTGTMNTVYGAFQVVGDPGSRFGMIDLGTGALTLNAGFIGSAQSNNSVAIRGIAVETVPEPATMLIAGFAGLAALARRKRKS